MKLTKKEVTVLKKHCYGTLKLQFFIYKPPNPWISYLLQNKDYVLRNRQQFRMNSELTEINRNGSRLPVLRCKILDISVGLLLSSNHETYILLGGDDIGAVAQSYSYQQSSEEIRKQILTSKYIIIKEMLLLVLLISEGN